MMRIRFRGFSTFRARIFWSVIPILVVLLIFHGVMDLREHRRLFTDEFMRRGQAMASNLAYSGELGVFAEDRKLLESSMRGVAGDLDVAYVVVYGEDGKVLAEGPGQDGVLPVRKGPLSDQEQQRLLQERRPLVKTMEGPAGNLVEFLAPIMTEAAKSPDELVLGSTGPGPVVERRAIGVVRLGLSLRSIEHRMGILMRLWVGVTLFFLTLSTIAVYFFSQKVTAPVKRLTEHAEKMGRGSLDEIVPVETRDEIGQLAGTLNDMAYALKGNIREKERILAELQDLNRTLEDRIHQRTAELEDRTDALQHSLDEVRAMGDISRAVSSSLEVREVLDTVSAHAVRLSSSDACGIYEVDPVRNAFIVVTARNLSREFVEAIQAADPRQGILSRATDTRQPMQIDDLAVANDFPLREIILREGLRALLAVPIGSGGHVRGIVLYRRKPGFFEESTVNLLTTLANQSKVAIENAQLFQEVSSQRVRLETLSQNIEQLYRLSTAMQEPLSLRDQLARVLEAARQVIRIDRFLIWEVSPEGNHLIALVDAGFSEEERQEFAGIRMPLTEAGAMAEAHRTGIPVAFDRDHPVPRELRLRPPYSERRGLRSSQFLVVPMIARGRVVGLLTADNKVSREPVPPQTVGLLQIFASHAAVAIENARLFHEIGDKSRQLEIASRHKSQFLANMSHELRTPLNAILGYTELILDDIFGEVPPQIRDTLERTRSNGLHLLGLINDVLDLSKIEAGQLTLSLGDYSMGEVIHAALSSLRSLAEEKKLAFKALVVPDLPTGKGDERRITQVLLNLIGNAIKFTEAGQVTVEAGLSDGAFLVSVSDTGPGISLADQQKIFDEFQQADSSSTRRKGGTGLGLSIARRIIELHGGRIWVESTVGRGSTFRFTVPVRVEA
jgi:signal transduction histidine kinase/HAMP domain-containing protein